jgi:hypothetical protein
VLPSIIVASLFSYRYRNGRMALLLRTKGVVSGRIKAIMSIHYYSPPDFCRIFRSCFFATLHSFRLSYGIFDTSQQTTSATSTSTRHNGLLLSSSSSLGTDGTYDGSLDLDGPADGNVEGSLDLDGTEDGIDDASIDLNGLDEGKVDGALDSDGTADGTDDGWFFVPPGCVIRVV